MGSRVSTQNEWLQITIGGDDTIKRKKKKKPNTNRVKSTKYTLITFLPQNLLEQFRRLSNFYFLVIAIVSLVIDSPVSPITSLLPLLFVIAVTAIKQGYEDILRYKTDNIVNCSPVTVIRDGQETIIECQYVEPGDLVVVSRDCDVPCDLVLLKSSDRHGKCFVTTANLDGESSLKVLNIPRELPNVKINKMHKLGIIECECSMTDLYSFNGKIELADLELMGMAKLESPHKGVLPLTADNVLLRGSRVKNTECVIGCAVYTGMQTKLALNSRLTRNKFSSSEAYINWFLIVIMVGLVLIVTFFTLMQMNSEMVSVPNATYIGPALENYDFYDFVQDFLSFVILFNYLIPISLYVTIELHRVIGGFFMEWDIEMYDELTDQHCIVNTSDLNEELGQINILFSDKTGTLTKNEMIFQQCSINGNKFLYKKTKLQEVTSGATLDINQFSNDHKNFFQALSICHTVQVAGTMLNSESNKYPKGKMYPISDFINGVDLSDSKEKQNGSIRVSNINNMLDESQKFERDFAEHQRETPINAHGVTIEQTNFQSLKRPSSEVDLLEYATVTAIQTHRRTQSHGVPMASWVQPVHFMGHRRTPSSTSREGYAMPNFISRQPSMMLRAESVRRKKKIQTVVEALDYQASSPDEKALVEACAHLGFVYIGDDDQVLKVRVCPPHMDYSRPFSMVKSKDMFFERLHVLEFTSDRKRMSVIVKDDKGVIWIYTKGAESYVFPLCAPSSSRLIELTDRHITEFAQHGLRTLAVARRRIPDDEYRELVSDLNDANNSLQRRKQLIEDCYAKTERNLDLLGATAVEDALQDDVADTLESIQKAGIKVWVLTGDKVETALNIALSCGHVRADSMKYFIIECNQKEDLEVHLQTLEREIACGDGRTCALLIDGKSLTVALKELPHKFRDISIRCEAVLCCRLSPLQKSEVVSLIKTSKFKYCTAAIGDGANDVSMIQEAHVGIGIMGNEGRQAARCGDFAFARFNMLKRLLLVHGHYHTTRLSYLVLYFFYKNILFMGIMFLFQFYCMFSSESIYDSWFLTFYNTLYTALPILFISVTEKPFIEKELLSNPGLYKRNTHNKLLQWPPFLEWMSFGTYHSLIIFYFTFYVFSINDVLLNVGQTAELAVFGTQLMQVVVIVANLKLWLETKYHSYWFIVTIWGSIIFFVETTVDYNLIDLRLDSDIYWSYNKLLCSIPLWLLTFICTIACLVPDYAIRVYKEAINMPKRTFFSLARNIKTK